MELPKFKDIKKSSVYITPNFPVLQTKRYKFSLFTVLAAILGYTLAVTVLVILILVVSPARNIIFFFENEKLDTQVERVKELEGKVLFLSTELQKLASTNERLKYAMILASADSLDSAAAVYDSLRQPDPPINKSGGNLLEVFRDFIKMFQDEKPDVYFLSPVNGVIIKEYDPQKGHLGIDYGVKKGTNIHAAFGGVITFAGFTPEYGHTLMILHPDNYITVYRHCEVLLKRERESVQTGEVIALSGESGYKSTGPHLHFEIWLNGKTLDPEKFIINN
jgi:murein DD-endopeptidase MepM/ murein hydrolase activator NlpD